MNYLLLYCVLCRELKECIDISDAFKVCLIYWSLAASPLSLEHSFSVCLFFSIKRGSRETKTCK